MFWGEPKPSWYCSTSCTSSSFSSFPSKEVTFNVRSQCAQFPAIAGHPACSTPDLNGLQCSWWAHWEGGLLGQDPTTTCSPLSCPPRLGSRKVLSSLCSRWDTLAPWSPSHQSPLNHYLSDPSPEPMLPWVTSTRADCPQQQSSQEKRGSQMPPPRKGGNVFIVNLCWCQNKILLSRNYYLELN